MIKEGSKWINSDNTKTFYVMSIVEIDGNTWVHYREVKTGNEYSCYEESFLQRFKPTVD